LNAQPLERDAVKAIKREIPDPVYRVDFWYRRPAAPGEEQEKIMYKQDAYRATDVENVAELLAWAQENAEGRGFVVYVEIGIQGEPGLIRLHGRDPN
jgi:hypothetical protein